MQYKLGTLYLIPSLLDDEGHTDVIPDATVRVITSLSYFFVETEKAARRFLRRFSTSAPIRELTIRSVSSVDARDAGALLEPLLQGVDAGLLSDAGCPCVADPGSAIVRAAHERGIRVVPLIGPSSLLLALMASGLNGQQFTFHGYLPPEDEGRRAALQRIEQVSHTTHYTQLFIETPYRSQKMFADALKVCHPDTLFCVATNLSTPSELVRTKRIAAWRDAPDGPGKSPTIFLLLRPH
jgi:16S rRNA (cytidine1402-2'-O)-methyltransferase